MSDPRNALLVSRTKFKEVKKSPAHVRRFFEFVRALHEAPASLALDCIVIPGKILEFVCRMTLLTGNLFRSIMDNKEEYSFYQRRMAC